MVLVLVPVRGEERLKVEGMGAEGRVGILNSNGEGRATGEEGVVVGLPY